MPLKISSHANLLIVNLSLGKTEKAYLGVESISIVLPVKQAFEALLSEVKEITHVVSCSTCRERMEYKNRCAKEHV